MPMDTWAFVVVWRRVEAAVRKGDDTMLWETGEIAVERGKPPFRAAEVLFVLKLLPRVEEGVFGSWFFHALDSAPLAWLKCLKQSLC